MNIQRKPTERNCSGICRKLKIYFMHVFLLRGGADLSPEQLSAAPTDYTKPRQTIQIHKILDNTINLDKNQKY